jgi:small subunit ribosomal protein S21
MIIVDVSKCKNIDQALKKYKSKHNKLGIVKKLRARQQYVKPSVIRREEILNAIYKEKKYKKN